MSLYKGQNIITGSYMLPRADDNRQVNVSRKSMHKKKEKNKRKEKMKEERKITQQKIKKQGVQKISVKEAQVYPVLDSGACDIRRKGIHCISERSRQLMHEEVQKIYLSIFLSLYPKISAIASGATPIGSAGCALDDIYS
jgi:hypothetical protein